MSRGDSNLSTFVVLSLASRLGLRDIDRLWLRVTQKNLKKLGSPGTARGITPFEFSHMSHMI